MMKFLLVLSCCILIASTISAFDNIQDLWEKYKAKFQKSYSDTEDATRKNRFADNILKMAAHNLAANLGMHSWTSGFNQFTDWTDEELDNHYKGCLTERDSLGGIDFKSLNLTISSQDVPKHKDWRKENVLTPAKHQGECGSCWAFAGTGALEAHLALKEGKSTSLSEQNVVDCAKEYGGPEHGCKGGTLTDAFNYVKENNGIDTEESYPYVGKEQDCQFSKSDIGGTCKAYVSIKNSEEDVMKVVGTIGPVITSVDARPFHRYHGGVFHVDDCSGKVNHAVLIVGYGKKHGEKYWIIKNSWGPNFGSDGYMYIRRNAPYMCSIAKEVTYPIL